MPQLCMVKRWVRDHLAISGHEGKMSIAWLVVSGWWQSQVKWLLPTLLQAIKLQPISCSRSQKPPGTIANHLRSIHFPFSLFSRVHPMGIHTNLLISTKWPSPKLKDKPLEQADLTANHIIYQLISLQNLQKAPTPGLVGYWLQLPVLVNLTITAALMESKWI